MKRLMLAVAIVLILLPAISERSAAQHDVDQALVNIEAYKYFEIQVAKGDDVRITARVEALSYPVSVFLIKGKAEFDKFVESDLVNVDDLRKGNISEIDDTFTVVSSFSIAQTELFDETITIGDADTYYLVIMLYRDASMDPDEVLTSRATLVNYDIEWTKVRNNVPWYLIPIALIIGAIGIGLIAYYFWPRPIIDQEDEAPERGPAKPPKSFQGRMRSRI
jgi:hypothetical protein